MQVEELYVIKRRVLRGLPIRLPSQIWSLCAKLDKKHKYGMNERNEDWMIFFLFLFWIILEINFILLNKWSSKSKVFRLTRHLIGINLMNDLSSRILASQLFIEFIFICFYSV